MKVALLRDGLGGLDGSLGPPELRVLLAVRQQDLVRVRVRARVRVRVGVKVRVRVRVRVRVWVRVRVRVRVRVGVKVRVQVRVVSRTMTRRRTLGRALGSMSRGSVPLGSVPSITCMPSSSPALMCVHPFGESIASITWVGGRG